MSTGVATAPPAFDAISFSAGGTTDRVWTHNPIGTPKGIIVQVIQAATGADQVSTVTYGVATLSRTGFNSGSSSAVYTYFLGTSVPTGAQTVTVTVSNSATKVGAATSITAGTDCSVAGTDVTINSSSLANPSGTIPLTAKTCYCQMAFMSGQADPTGVTELSSWTNRSEADFGTQVGGLYTYDIIGNTDVTDGWTQTAAMACGYGVAVSSP